MDTPNAKRNKKADKARKNFEKTGGKSSRHVRAYERVSEAIHAAKPNFGIPNHSRGLIPKSAYETLVSSQKGTTPKGKKGS